jgi:colanic acid/amylovoran biosynthesis glycosyltransferase
MKVLMFSDDFGGPTTTFIQNDLMGLTKNHQVKYLCIQKNNQGNFKYDDLEVVPFKMNSILRKLYWILETNGLYLNFKNTAFAKRVNKIIHDFQPDIIQCNFGIEALRLTDNLNAQNGNIPVVINFLGYDASFHLKRASYVSKLIDLAKQSNVYATCNTSFLKKNLEVRDVFFQENRVIHTGVNLDFFNRDGNYPAHAEYVFLQIAILTKRKGQDIAILAFKRMLEKVSEPQKYKLILAGGNEGDYGRMIRQMPKRLGIESQVQFSDWITPAVSKDLMLNADCFLHHSRKVEGRTEGIPTAISEAMAMELPIISTWHAGIPDLVGHGENGYLVEEGDVEELAQRMIDIQSFGYRKNNREKVMNYFNIKTRTAAFEKYYAHILEKGASSSSKKTVQ